MTPRDVGEVKLLCGPRYSTISEGEVSRSHLPQPWAHILKSLRLCGLLTLQAVSEAGWMGTHLLDVCDVHQLDHLVPL